MIRRTTFISICSISLCLLFTLFVVNTDATPCDDGEIKIDTNDTCGFLPSKLDNGDTGLEGIVFNPTASDIEIGIDTTEIGSRTWGTTENIDWTFSTPNEPVVLHFIDDRLHLKKGTGTFFDANIYQ